MQRRWPKDRLGHPGIQLGDVKAAKANAVRFTCSRVCTAWVTGKTPSVADRHSENPMKYPILRHPRMMVMSANNAILPKWGGEGVETHTYKC